MTKSFSLTYHNHYYTAVTLKKIKHGNHTLYNKINAPALCSHFVQWCLHSTPIQITLQVSTDEIPNSLKISVIKNGFYRWYYSCPNFPLHGNLSPFVEDSLNKLFPNAKSNGLDSPHPLYLKFLPEYTNT